MIPFPDKKYQIIYADPPWDYTYVGKNFDKNFKRGKYGFDAVISAHDHYPSMSIDEIKALPVSSICEKNCLCFIWVTGPFFELGIDVLKAWDFTYVTVGFVWDKQKTMPGFYTLSQCEFVIIGKKGNIPKPRGARNIRQFFSFPRGEHSRKPDEFRDRISKMFPTLSKIELFARKTYPGWDAWGNEVQKFDSIPEKIKEGFFE